MERPEGTLAVLLGISQLVYLVAIATLGVRVLLRARRTRELPEGLLSLHLLLCCSLGYLLLVVVLSAAQTPGSLPVGVVAWLVALGHLASSVGVWAGYGLADPLDVAVAYWLTLFPSPAYARLVTRAGSASP